ncbi:hypothetical protein MK852_19515 [Shewanella benthica]|nr:hypothetical protein [Shewanella benthica]
MFVAGISVTQCVVFVFWIYKVLAFNSVEELIAITALKWHEGIVTAWNVSAGITAKLTLLITTYILIQLVIKKSIGNKRKTKISSNEN